MAAKLRSEAGLDADAVALHILLLEASHAQDTGVADSLAEVSTTTALVLSPLELTWH